MRFKVSSSIKGFGVFGDGTLKGTLKGLMDAVGTTRRERSEALEI